MKKIVICINKNDKYEHHRKLTIGGKYLSDNSFINKTALCIYDVLDNYIGYYNKENFIGIDEYRDNKIEKIFK